MSRGAVVAVVLAVVAVAVHAPLWPTAFYFDDHAHLLLAERASLVEVVSSGLFATYFRPLGQAVWWVLARPGVSHPVTGHLLVAVALLLTLVLVAGTLRALGTSREAAAVFAVFGGLLPTTVVTAAWVSNLYGVLSALAGWAAVRAALAKRRWVASAGCGGLLVAAMAAKEDGVAFAVAVVAVGLAEPDRGRRIPIVGAALAAIAVWAPLRWAVLGRAGTAFGGGDGAAWLGGTAAAALVLMAVALAARDPRVRVGVALASVAVPAWALMWVLSPADRQVPDLRLRFGYLAGLALLPLVAAGWDRIRTAAAPTVRIAMVVAVIAAAVSVAVDTRAVAGWRIRTGAAGALVDRVVAAAEAAPERRLALVPSGAPEIGLDPAVRRRLGAAAPVVVRPAREQFLVVPPNLWPAVRGRIVPTALPGNPTTVAGLLVVHGYAVPPAWTDPDPMLGSVIVVR